MMRLTVLILSGFLLTGCMTSFMGAAKVPNGAAGCKVECDARGMQLTGMVVMGEYSDGCICQPRDAAKADGVSTATAAGPAVAGVVMQMQKQRQQQQQQAGTRR